MSLFAESTVEEAALQWFGELSVNDQSHKPNAAS